MNGSNENQLIVYIGQQRKVATITLGKNSESNIHLSYDEAWVQSGFAISPHLPLNGDFSTREVRNFLQNLLPEGTGLEEITSNTTISKNNVFGLIKIIGEETSGALSFKSAASTLKKTSYREISEEELNIKLSRFKNNGESVTYWDGKTRLSVAGVQDKLNILEMDDKLGFGEGELCSNKIFKFETGKAPFIAANELFTMLLAKEIQLTNSPVEIRTYGGVRTFVIERFDRRIEQFKQRVARRHVIDGCQVTNLPPSYKYERQHGDDDDGIYYRDGVSFPKLFDVKTLNNQTYQTVLIKWMIFNILVKNYDAHGKNISFFVAKQGLELTPFYDLVNIEAIIQTINNKHASKANIPNISQSYAMSIGDYEAGNAGNFKSPITAYMLADFAYEFGISLARLQLLISTTISSVLGAISTAKENALKQQLTDEEIEHIDLCINIINKSATELNNEVTLLPEMKPLFED